MVIKFDVFGKKMSVIQKEHGWQLFNESDTGVRSRVYDVIIPPDIEENELAQYLDDIYHEFSTESHSKVKKLN